MWSELIGNNLHFIFNTNHDLAAQIKLHTGLFEIITYQSYDKQVLMHILSPNTFFINDFNYSVQAVHTTMKIFCFVRVAGMFQPCTVSQVVWVKSEVKKAETVKLTSEWK